MTGSNHRPFPTLAMATAVALVSLFLLGPAAPARSAGTECGIDPARPSVCRIELALGIHLDADFSALQYVPNPDGTGFSLRGDFEIPTGGEPVVLGEAEVAFVYDETGEPVFVNGTALMPFPTQGFLSHIEVERQPMVSFGVDLGSELGFTGAPLVAERSYLYFYGNSIFEAGYGAISMTTPGAELSMVLDPSDPYFYIGGELIGLGDGGKKDGEGDGSGSQTAGSGDGSGTAGGADASAGDGSTDGGSADGSATDPNAQAEGQPEGDGQSGGDEGGDISKMGFAFSLNGLIPFTPLVTNGLEDRMPSFDGNVYVSAPVALHGALTLQGQTVFSIDPDHDGDHPFEPTFYDGSSTPDLAVGGNGVLSVGVPFLKFLEFGFDLGTATAVGIVSEEQASQVVFSGLLGPEQSDVFGELPVPMSFPDPLELYGAYSPTELGSFFHAEGEIGLDPAPIGALFGVELGPIQSWGAKLDANSLGLTVSATTSMSPYPPLGFAESTVTAHVSPDGVNSYVALDGDMALGSFALEGARFEVHLTNGVTVTGGLRIHDTVFGMTGTVGGAGYALSGEAMLADAVEINATRALDLGVALLQTQESRQAIEISLEAANVTLSAAVTAASAAQAAVDAAQAEVNKIQNDINVNVSRRSSAYNSYKYWKGVSCKWYDAACQANRAAKISYYWGKYTYYSGIVSTLSAAKTAALGVLSAAQATLETASTQLAAARSAVETLQSELDAITAQAAELQAQLDALPDIEGELRPIVTATIEDGELSGTVRAEWNGTEILDGRVDFATGEACVTVPVPGTGELCSPL